jgi:hypothetical protein
MHDKNNVTKHIGIILIVFASMLLTSCKYLDSKKETRKLPDSLKVSQPCDTLLIRDTLYVDVLVPYPVLKDTIIYKEVFASVDTSAILRLFERKNFYLDTLKFDYGYVAISDTISGSNIVSRKYVPKFKIPVKEKIQTIKEEPRGNLYLGLNGGLDKPNYVYSLGTSFLYKTPNDKIYQLGIGVWNKTFNGIDGQFVPYVQGGVYWKIRTLGKK